MADLNSINLTGYLGKDAKFTRTQKNTTVANFSLGNTISMPDGGGSWKKVTTWFNVSSFGADADYMQQYGSAKGTRLAITGKLFEEKYTGRDNVEHTSLKIVATSIIILDSKGAAGQDFDEEEETDEWNDDLEPVRPQRSASQPPTRQVARAGAPANTRPATTARPATRPASPPTRTRVVTELEDANGLEEPPF
jgi:single stranded DNA-binding protein